MNSTLTYGATRFLSSLSVLVFTTLVVDVMCGVVTRYVFGHQVSWSEELARLLLVWLAMLGSALAYASQSHLGVDALVRVLAPPAQRAAGIAIHTTTLFFVAGVMVYGGTLLFTDRWQAGQVMSTVPIRQAWTYLAVPVSGLFMTVVAVEALVRLVVTRTPSLPAEDN